MNALKRPGRIWTNVTRVTPPSVYWSCARPVPIPMTKMHAAATAHCMARFIARSSLNFKTRAESSRSVQYSKASPPSSEPVYAGSCAKPNLVILDEKSRLRCAGLNRHEAENENFSRDLMRRWRTTGHENGFQLQEERVRSVPVVQAFVRSDCLKVGSYL